MNFLKMKTVHKINNIDLDNISFEDLKKQLKDIQNDISEALIERQNKNHEQYNKSDLAHKRKLKHIANSKIAIRKLWFDRKNRKEDILKHIEKIKNIDTFTFSNVPAKKRAESKYLKDVKLIKELYFNNKTLENIVSTIGYGTKQSLSTFINKNIKNAISSN